MIEIIIAIMMGIILGIFSGLTPGVHINLISVVLLSVSPFLLKYTSPLIICVIIVAMAVTHTFLDTIPSIFLGAPNEDTVLSILPGHRLLLQGKGFEAVMLTIFGSYFGMVVSVIFVPLLLILVGVIYPIIQKYIAYILILISLFLIFREKNKLWALILFLLSGCLGIAVFNLPINDPLFPLFSGLFGISMLLMSLNDNTKIPKQEFGEFELEDKYKAVGGSFIMGWISSFMPGLGPAQAAIICSQFMKLTEKGFLILVGGLSTVNTILSLVTLYSLGKARSGAVVVMSKIIENVNLNDLLIFIAVVLIAGGVATILTCRLSKVFSQLLEKVNYKKLCWGIIIFVITLVVLLTGIWGVLILIISTCLGLIPSVKKIGRNHMMGCLLIPVIIYFL